MKNGQKAVMESITRKLETQGIHVRTAAGPHSRNAVGVTTIDSDPDTQCAVDAVASKHRKGRWNIVTEMYEADNLHSDVPQVEYVHVFHRMTSELRGRLASHASQRFPGSQETQMKITAHVEGLFRGQIPGFWDNTPRCTVCQKPVENTDAALKSCSSVIYGEFTLYRHPECGRRGPTLWGWPPPSGDPKRRRSTKMSEVMKIQEPIEKVRETASLPDVAPSREYGQKDNWYSLMAQMFHAPSVLNSLPDTWCLTMKANRAHLVIMLREAGAGHDPFGNAEWSSTPTQVWENLAQVQQLPTLDGADLSGVDFKWADFSNTDLSNANLTGADLRWADLKGANLTGADLRWATLMGANLKGVDLRDTMIDGTILVEADLTGASVTGLNLNAAYVDDQTRLDGAIGLEL